MYTEAQRQWQKNNRDKVNENTRRYRKKHQAALRKKDRGRYRANLEAGRAKGRKFAAAYRKKYPLRVVDAKLRDNYGITFEQYEEMRKKQKNRCAICGKKETALRAGKIRRLSVDHCHSKKVVRGLLCARCNSAIGLLFHSDLLIKAAARYVTRPPFSIPSK